MEKMGWLRKRRGMVALCLVLVLSALLIQPAAVYAAKPDAAATGDSVIQITTKVTYPYSSYSTPEGKVPWGHSGQQFADITGRLGELPEGMNRYAIVIGSNFEGAAAPGGQVPPLIPPFTIELNYAENDAWSMAGLLMVGYGFDTVIPLVGEDASRDNILAAIEQVRDWEERGDEVVFFYSGHGASRVQGEKATGTRGWGAIHEGIVTDEGDGQNVGFIWDDELKKAFQHYDTDRIVFIFDSCLSGGMTELAKKGRIVCMATTKTGIAAEGDPAWPESPENGLFTAFLLAALTGQEYPWPGMADIVDHDGDPLIPDVTIEEAFNFASYMLIMSTESIQEGLAYQEFLLELPAGSLTGLWGTPTILDLFKQDLLP